MPDKSMLSGVVIASCWPTRDQHKADVLYIGRDQSDERRLTTRIADAAELLLLRARSANGFERPD